MFSYAYCRYSSDNQDEKSNEDQEKEITEYATKHNIKILGFYFDEAKTGTKDNREGFLNMMKDCARKKEVQSILIWKFNRFARNKYDSAIYKKKLKDLGIRVISITQPIDNSPEGVLLETLIEGMDEYYSLNLASDVQRGLRQNAKEAKFNGGIAPLRL